MQSTIAGEDTASAQLTQLLEDSWEYELRESPTFATRAGDHRFNDRLPRVTLADQRMRLRRSRQFLSRWEAINRDQLSRAERINYDIYGRLLRDSIAEYEFESYLIPITNRGGFHVTFPELPRQVPLETTRDYENYVARLGVFARYAKDHIELMRAGIEKGMVLPAVVLEGYEDSLIAHVVSDTEESLLFAPFKDFPDGFSAEDCQRLSQAGREAIMASVVPGYQDFLDFMRDEYVPACRPSIAAADLPNGREFYRHRVRKFTTLDLTPEQVHRTGMEEVRRIRKEMQSIIEKLEFEGDFAAFVEHLRTDPRFYVDSPEALEKEVAFVLKRMDGKLPQLFKTLPRMPYGIREVPAYIAPKTTTAYYNAPLGDGTSAGFYYINTYDLASRPLYEIEALSFHEAVPGHHLQIALQQEMTDLPPFRRFAGVTAFVEGWALYSERLGLEVGFYQDPYSDFGRLTYEMWRACRLVVDTGMHYLGWSRQRAIDFMAGNTALSRHNIRAEVDRYISWPGQALAYKIGELRIRELRSLAERELGPRFDLREFHDVVLGSGAVPLSVLEGNVRAHINSVRGQDGNSP